MLKSWLWIMVVSIVAAFSVSTSKAEVVIDIPKIAGKSKVAVEAILGKATSCTKSKYGLNCNFTVGDAEIVFIDGKADWITVNSLGTVAYGKETLELLGLSVSVPSFSNSNVMKWQNINGLHSVSLFPAGKSVFYAYIKVKTK